MQRNGSDDGDGSGSRDHVVYHYPSQKSAALILLCEGEIDNRCEEAAASRASDTSATWLSETVCSAPCLGLGRKANERSHPSKGSRLNVFEVCALCVVRKVDATSVFSLESSRVNLFCER